jgi:hypothetical protein
LEGLRIKNVSIFYDHVDYFTAIWRNLSPFGHLVYFSGFGMFGPRKIWQPWYKHDLVLYSFFLRTDIEWKNRGDCGKR